MAFQKLSVTGDRFTPSNGTFDPVEVTSATTQVYVRSATFHSDTATDWTLSIQDPEDAGNKTLFLSGTASQDAVIAINYYLPTSDEDKPDACQFVFESTAVLANAWVTFDYSVEKT